MNKEERRKYVKEYRQTHKKKIKRYRKKYYQKNKEKNKEYHKQYYQENKENIKEQSKQCYQRDKEKWKEWGKRYYQEHKKKIKEYQKQYYQSKKGKEKRSKRDNIRYRTDIKYNLSRRISYMIHQALHDGSGKQGRSWETLVGYTTGQLKRHLKRTMPDGYSWQDYLEGRLHIDHIFPKSIFNFTSPEDIDFQRCWALDNLQLLPVKENISKGAKLLKPFQKYFPIKVGITQK